MKRMFKDVSGLDHPTPAHIRGCVLDSLLDAADARGTHVPKWITDAVFEGVKVACKQHDEATA